MEIPQQARKCPYCLQFQGLFPRLLRLLPVILFCLFFALPLLSFPEMFDDLKPGEDYAKHKDQIVVSNPKISFGTDCGNPVVIVFFNLKNNSSVSWQDFRFHLDFFDATGKQFDLANDSEYQSYLPAMDSCSFKVSQHQEFPQSNYVTCTVHVLKAADARHPF